MAYGDYNGADKPNKGHEGGACNRTRCQCEPAVWYNHGSMSWYCEDCARDIGQDSFNLRDWKLNYEPRRGHPMFETRTMMNQRVNTLLAVIDVQKNDYIAEVGYREYECLVALVNDGTVKTLTQLAEYGIDTGT